jgi:deoxyribose-phosphate aldolase
MTLEEIIRQVWDEIRDFLTSRGGTGVTAPLGAPGLSRAISAAIDAREDDLIFAGFPVRGEKSIQDAMESTCLSPVTTAKEIERFVRDSLEARCGAVCVLPCHLERARRLLEGHSTLLVSVAGFPLGASETPVKINEASLAASRGADEVDFVVNLSWLKDADLLPVFEEVAQVKKAVGPGKRVKAILEVGYLSDLELAQASIVAILAGADFIKTSTGFGPRGVFPRDITLLTAVLGSRAAVKASGGIRTLVQVRDLLGRGASRIGTSSALSILRDLRGER